jgi:hypothetical protein
MSSKQKGMTFKQQLEEEMVRSANRVTELHDKRYRLTREWIDLDDKNDLAHQPRINEIEEEIEEVDLELGVRDEVVITVRGGVAEIRHRSDDDTLVTIIDYDNEAENGMEDAR